MTERERNVLDLAMKWRNAKLAVEEALIRQQFIRAVDMLVKGRRDAKVEKAPDTPPTAGA